MGKPAQNQRSSRKSMPTVAVACQGGGMHAAFEVGVLVEILEGRRARADRPRGIERDIGRRTQWAVAWYGLAPKNGSPGSKSEAASALVDFWEGFVASTTASRADQFFDIRCIQSPGNGDPWHRPPSDLSLIRSEYSQSLAMAFYLSLACVSNTLICDYLLNQTCPRFDSIDWKHVKTQLLVGAYRGCQRFRDRVRLKCQQRNATEEVRYWRQRLPLTLSGVVASGTLPIFRQAERSKAAIIGTVSTRKIHRFGSSLRKPIIDEVPDEIWIVRINPQQWPELPETMADIGIARTS